MTTKHVARVWEEMNVQMKDFAESVKFRVYAPNFATFRNRPPNSLTAPEHALELADKHCYLIFIFFLKNLHKAVSVLCGNVQRKLGILLSEKDNSDYWHEIDFQHVS